MKDVFNKRQRFSLRKYSVGVCSVLLGTALFAAGAQSASADEATAASESAGTAASEAAQPATTESSQAEAPAASKAYGEGASVPKIDLSGTAAATSERPASATEKTEAAATPAATEKQVAPAETKKTEEASKPLNVGSLPEIALPTAKKADTSSKPAPTTAATTAQPTATRAAAGESSERAAAREEVATPAGTTTFSATVSPAGPITGTEASAQAESAASTDAAAAVANANNERTNAGALAVSSRRRGKRALTDHNNEPVSVETYLKNGEVATPDMTDPNGATVSSQPVPSGYQAKEGDFYTYAIWDLTKFNERYGTKYYARAYKRFDASTDTTVELIDKTTGSVLETRNITSSSGVQKFTTTTAASNSQLTFQVDYKAGTAEKGKVAEPFIQNGYEVGKSITDLVAAGHQLTPAEQKLYTDVYNARTTTDILNVVEPAYNGRTITDSNAKIPVTINKTTYYKVVDKNNPTFNANKTDKTVQDYKENGNEVDLAKYTTKAMEGQSFTASGERQFDGYKLYQTADANDTSGTVSRPYTVGTKFMDADRYGIKRIKEVVGEDGSVVIRVYLLDPRQQSKRSDGSLSTDGYMLLAETKPIKPGEWNSQDLVVKKTPLRTISYTETNPKTGAVTQYPNGKEVPFDFQKASGYTPYHTVFVPFLGDGIGHGSANSQLERGVEGIGTNVDLLNTLTPYKQPVYYYVKQEPVEVTPEVEKQLEGRVLANGEFTFKLKEVQPNKSLPSYEETVTNKADGKATFNKLTFNKVGTYTYTITETPGSDANVEYDAMTVTMTVNVTKNAQGDLVATTKYSAEGGFKSSADDKVFNNYVVAPVKTKFDFSKALAGRELKAGEFSFVLKDAAGHEVETVKNDADGNVTFSELSFDNTKVGTHTYTVEEVIPSNKEFGMTYDQMKATVTVKVAKNGHSLTTVTNVTSTGGKDANGNATDGTADKEFNNKVTPPETPKFQPEKFVVSKEKYDITGDKLMDDDNELTNEYTETNADPYVDKTTNNEPENLNTKTVKRGSKLVYQVWLDTTKFTEANNIQYVGVSDTYDADKLDVNAADIKAYDSVTGAEVTNKFDIKVENGTITATSKDEFIKDKVNAPVIDTTKFEFGRYYKFDIPATVKESVKAGADIENTANQTVHVYNPVSKTVEKPEKPTQKRVNSVPVPVEMNFTKRLEGRELQKNEFEFVLKKDGVEVERVKNDAAGKIVFKTLEFGRDDLGKTYNYTVEETPGTDATVKYDTMVATVKVVVSHDGTAKAIVANVTDAADKEFNNRVTPPEEPKFQPEKYVVSKEKYDITGDKLVDDDRELADKYADTNANPYADDASNNEAENLNTKTVERGSKLVYQVWLDTTKFDAANKDNIQTVGISDNYDEAKLNLNKADIKAYDSVTGAEVTDKFDITVNNGVITANLKAGFTKSLGDAENTQVIDTTKFAFGRYYKFDIPTTVKDDVVAGADIENTAAQVVNYYNPTTKKVEKPEKPTEKRVNNVPISVEFNFTKKLEGRDLKAGEFTFELKDSDNVVIATATNDASGNFKFTPVDYTNKAGKTVTALKYQKGQEGTYTYTVTEVKGKDSTVTYDEMAAVVTVKVSHDGTAKALITNVTEPADKEFNNRVTPPTEPKFQPEKYVVSKAKFDITGTKLVDDDSELTDKYGETNTNPYVDTTANNEDENLNTKPVERGQKLYYQVWLDTTKFDANNKDNIQTVGITDNYDKDKLTVNASDIKVYDSVTGADVTTKFDISDNNGVLTANLKDGFTKSLGDAENTQIIDTTKFEFGRYYKFDIPATVKDDVVAGADIENKAAQVVNYYNPVSKTVEKPNKPTEKRVNSVPISVEFNFTKKLEGRDLKAGEFSFVLKDSTGKTLETVKNDASGNVKFKALEFKKGQEGVHNYTVEEVKGSDATVTYDTMKANVTVTVKHDGTAKVLIATVGDIADKEFNNRVTPPEEPKFQPEKYVLNTAKFSITDNKLLDDDAELTDKYGETNTDPYVDKTGNNEAENINTKSVKRGEKIYYQVWLDTTKFDAANKDNVQTVGITDDFDETKVDVDGSAIKAYDGKTGADVTAKFDITVNNGVITATLKDGFTKSLGDAENTQVIDTTKFEFGRYYKFDIPATVKADVAGGVDIENTAAQVVNYYNPTTKKVEKPEKPTEKRVNSVPVEVEFNFTKRMEGRELKANEFSFVLKDSKGNTLETVKNDKDGNVKFSKLEFKKGQEGVHNYTVEEVKGTDATVTYDTMKANVTVTVSHDGTAKVLIAKVGDIADKEFNNKVTPPETPEFNPEKYILNAEKFDLTGKSLLDDDKELADKVAETNANPYADKADNNEAANINTKTVKRGDKVVYQVWLDTTKFTEAHNIQSVGVTDDYEEDKLDINVANIKAYDSVTGEDVTAKFDIKVENGVISATSKADLTKSLGDAENTPVIDTTKFAFGRYYKFDIPATVKDTVKGGADIENTAAQIVHQYDPTSKTVKKPNKPTEKRVVNIPVSVEFNFTKRLEGRELKANEFSFVLKDSTGKVVETVKNDASGNVKFSALEFKKGQEGTYNYTVEEVKGTDTTVTYDTMKAVVTVEVSHDGTAKALLTKVTDPSDKEFNNTVRPPETPEFNPEKYILNESKFDLTGVKLLDDDDELKNKVADTNANPYVDKTDNNEAQNINTKTLKKGDKVYYQVWLDTTKFTEAHNIQSVGVTDKYDSANLTVNGADIKAYDSVTGEDVTAKFDIKVENGVITATSKADLTKSLGDAENTQVIDTTKLAFGRYYKFEIPAEIKQSAQDGVDIENTASQIVHQYDPTKKTVEKPEKPTEKRVVNIPVKVQFQFTKKLEGRALKAGEFSFVLKDEKGNVIETVTNDAAGKITFSNLEFKRGEEGTHLYHVEEIRGTDSSVEYDKMVATVGIMINKDGKVLTAITQLPEDTEFNNTVIPPTTPPNTPPTTPPNTPPTTPPNTPPTTPPNTPPTPPTTPPTPPTPPTPTTPPAPALPETGEEQSASAALLGAALGMVGLAGLAKRKKRED